MTSLESTTPCNLISWEYILDSEGGVSFSAAAIFSSVQAAMSVVYSQKYLASYRST